MIISTMLLFLLFMTHVKEGQNSGPSSPDCKEDKKFLPKMRLTESVRMNSWEECRDV